MNLCALELQGAQDQNLRCLHDGLILNIKNMRPLHCFTKQDDPHFIIFMNQYTKHSSETT